MPGATSFRQTEEKQSSFVIDLMLWSPTMDLIAVTSITGEVFMILLIDFLMFAFLAILYNCIIYLVCKLQNY